jgi:DNA-binding MarR family transcriptional regulator
MDHARQGVQRLADALTQEGLIVYKDHPTDRRTKLLELTPKGHEVLGAIYLRQLAWSKGVMTKLNAEQLANMAHSLENIAQVLVAEVDMGNKGD